MCQTGKYIRSVCGIWLSAQSLIMTTQRVFLCQSALPMSAKTSYPEVNLGCDFMLSVHFLLGSYAYVEATAKERGQNARLISPTYHGSGVQCIEFWYHMYGFHVGTLNVYTNVSKFIIYDCLNTYQCYACNGIFHD